MFGAVSAHSGSSASPWKFTGEQHEGATGDTGYYFLRARYYDVNLGRFISRDPIEFDQRYAYAGGNPVLYTDLGGLAHAPASLFERRMPEEGDDGGGSALGPRGQGGIRFSKWGKTPDWFMTQAQRIKIIGAGRGNFSAGSATTANANALGRAWVGPDYRVSSGGQAWISADGLRQYWPPAYKKDLGVLQANFESRSVPYGSWDRGNGHMEILDPAFRLAE